MSDTPTAGKKTLTAEKAEVLNMPTRYKWKGASNSFALGQMAYSPNEIATLNIPPGTRERKLKESPVWNAPFLANGARVRVVMGKADQFRVFPIGATQAELEYMAFLMLKDVAAGVSRNDAREAHVMKGLMVPAMWLNKLEPEEAHDELFEETQKRMALHGVDNPKAVAAKLNFETLIRSLYLAVDAHMGSAGVDLLFALPSAEAQRYLTEVRTQTGVRKARSGLLASQDRKLTSAGRKKLLGLPVYTMLTDNEFGVSAAAHEANQSGPLGGISVDSDLRMPSHEAVMEVLGNMTDRNLVSGGYSVQSGIVIGPSGMPARSVMTTIAKLAAIAAHPEEWFHFHGKWLAEAMLRDPDISEQELARVMSWPDLGLMHEVDMTVVRVVTQAELKALTPVG